MRPSFVERLLVCNHLQIFHLLCQVEEPLCSQDIHVDTESKSLVEFDGGSRVKDDGHRVDQQGFVAVETVIDAASVTTKQNDETTHETS